MTQYIARLGDAFDEHGELKRVERVAVSICAGVFVFVVSTTAAPTLRPGIIHSAAFASSAMEGAVSRRRLLVIENFYPRPDEVRAQALRMSYEEPEGLTGWRTRPFEHRDTRPAIERALGQPVHNWEFDPDDLVVANGSFFCGLSAGPRAERVGVHYDVPRSYITMVVYLTPDAPIDAGTSFWQHRRTGLLAAPTRGDAVRLGATQRELDAELERSSGDPRRWIEVDRVGNVYNRAVVYASGLLHSATRHFGRNIRTGRLYQTLRFQFGN